MTQTALASLRTASLRTAALGMAGLALLGLAAGPAAAQQPAGPAPRVLLVGDSWSEFMWVNRSLRDVFAANGHPELVEQGGATTISGSTAAEWNDPARLQLITDALASNPTVEVVQLTIGGNDFLDGQSGGGWFASMGEAEFEALRTRILSDAEAVVGHILAQRPDLEVLISLYDYVNFDDATLVGCSGRWNDLGQPTPRQVNLANRAVQDSVEEAFASRPRVRVASHLGLMQFAFGFPDENIEPGDLMPPGDLDRPSPVAAMFSLFGFADCIHLSTDGYFAVGQNLWNVFYRDFFTADEVFRDDFESGTAAAW
ncbi:MAG: hypothetical protein AAF725_27965, partial [Acidobacteriota bacterium]